MPRESTPGCSGPLPATGSPVAPDVHLPPWPRVSITKRRVARGGIVEVVHGQRAPSSVADEAHQAGKPTARAAGSDEPGAHGRAVRARERHVVDRDRPVDVLPVGREDRIGGVRAGIGDGVCPEGVEALGLGGGCAVGLELGGGKIEPGHRARLVRCTNARQRRPAARGAGACPASHPARRTTTRARA